MDDLVENWDSPVKNASQVEEAVPVLRRALAAAGPGEVNRPIKRHHHRTLDCS